MPFGISGKRIGTFGSSLGLSEGAYATKQGKSYNPFGFNLDRFRSGANIPGATMQRPSDPTFQSMLGSGGMLQDKYKLYGKGPASEFERRLGVSALAEGLTPEAQAFQQHMIEQQRLGTQGQLGLAAQAGAGQLAQQRSAMAMRGGIGRGAAERMGTAQMRQLGLQQQQIRGQGEMAGLGLKADIGQKDLARKFGLRQSLAGVEAGRQESDINRAMQETQNKRAFDLQQYQAQMQAWAADQAAAEQRRLAATTGGLLGSGGVLGSGFKF